MKKYFGTLNHMVSRKMRRGFTLIELLVVVAIIGLLAAVVLASLGGARQSAREASILQSLRSIQNQAAIFYASNGTYEGLCDDPDITRMVSALEGKSDGAACFVATTDQEYIEPVMSEDLLPRDFSVAATTDDRYYAVSPQGVGTFDEENAVSGRVDWNGAKTACADDGARLPSPSALRAIHDVGGTTSAGFSTGPHWSFLEAPSSPTNAYSVYLVYGGVNRAAKSDGKHVRCVR